MAHKNEMQLENRCQEMLQNLGWDVTQEWPAEAANLKPDLTLWNHGELYGYVEIIKNMDAKDLQKRQNSIIAMLSSTKPKIFILTNGYSFDIFYNGVYSTTLSVPPPADEADRAMRLFAYYRKYKEMFRND